MAISCKFGVVLWIRKKYINMLGACSSWHTYKELAVNEALGIGMKLGFNTKNLPYFMEWKSTASGDYVIGLEPANSSVYGRQYHEKAGDLHTVEPFEKETTELKFTFMDGKEDIEKEITAFSSRF